MVYLVQDAGVRGVQLPRWGDVRLFSTREGLTQPQSICLDFTKLCLYIVS